MSRQARRLGAALALGFAGGVAAPVMVYVMLSHLGAPRAETRPAQTLKLEMEPSTPPPMAVTEQAQPVQPAAKPARHRRAAVEEAPIEVPRANPADLGRHVPSAPPQ